ncbi:tetratricopeptide repeat protein [Candidatus Latescibacterota bacterium]
MESHRKPSHAAEELERRKKMSPNKNIIVGLVLVIAVLVVGFGLYVRFGAKEIPVTETVAPPAEEIKSIAVLPFVNMSADPEQEYFCDGIADAILSALTHVGDLRVIARSSSFAFRGDAVDIREVGEKLDAKWVLEGSVQKVGNELRITAQLINVTDLSHLISNVYERELKDVFAIQEEIAQSVVDSLKVKLLDSERTAIEKRYTDNTEAYDLYLLGKNSKGISREQELEYFQKAVELDPDFALAYVAISETYYRLGYLGKLSEDESIQKSKEALDKALEIDYNLSEAHIMLGLVKRIDDWDWAAAEREYKLAIELDPGNERAHWQYAIFLKCMKRSEEGLKETKLARKLNPLSVASYEHAGAIYIDMGRYDDALEELNNGKAIDPNYGAIYRELGRLYRKQGQYDKSIEAIDKFNEISGFTEPSGYHGLTYAYAGERERAEEIINELKKLHPLDRGLYRSGYYFGYYLSDIASIYIAFGEYDEAFKWLEKAYDEHEYMLIWIKAWYEFDPIRSDSRFKALLKKMGLPED